MENWKIQFTAKATLPDNMEKPTYGEMVRFLFDTLGLKCEDIKCMHLSVSGKAIFFRCFKEETMRNIVENFDGAPFKYDSGVVARVQMCQESESLKYVRVWGIPPDAPDGDVAQFFANYGEVKRVVRERYPRELNCPIETGVRGLYMDLRQELSHFMYIRNFRIKIHYEGMKERCHGCGSTEHIKANCPKKTFFSPASRLEAAEKMVNLNNLLGDRNKTLPESSATPVSPVTTQEIPVTPAITFADLFNPPKSPAAVVLQTKEVPLEKKSADKSVSEISDDDVFVFERSSGTEMLPPAPADVRTPFRQSRTRAAKERSMNTRDRSSRSGSSSNGSQGRGRPKRKKSLPIDTIAKGHAVEEKEINSGSPSIESTAERPPLDEMLDDPVNILEQVRT